MKTTKIKHRLGLAVMALGMTMISLPAKAWEKNEFSVNGSVGMVSDYVWRGAYQGSGVSVQPSLTLGYAGLSLNVWGNQSLTKGAKEFDINLSYAYKNFSITVSDYWWSGEDQRYGDYSNSHYFEATLGYSISESFPLTFSWSTMFAGGDKNENGKLQGSTYISVNYPFALPYDITLTPAVGFTPWTGMYHDKAAFTDISLTAKKDIKISKSFSLPIFIQAIVAPVYDRTYLVGGVSIGF